MKVPYGSCALAVLCCGSVRSAENGVDWRDEDRLDYSYDQRANNGPDRWDGVRGFGEWEAKYDNRYVRQLGNRCSATLRPSPLDVAAGVPCSHLHEPLARQIDLSSDCGPNHVTYAVTPGSLRAYFPLDDSSCRRPRLTMSQYADDYVLLYMELHARSEHLVNGIQYDAELQMVHLSEARRNDYNYEQLSTVSLMLQADATRDDPEFQWFLDRWQETADREQQECADLRRNLRSRSQPASLRDYVDAAASAVAAAANDDDDDAEGAQSKRTVRASADPRRELQFQSSPCKSDARGRGCEPLGPRKRMFPYNLWVGVWYYFYFGSMTSPPCSDNVLYYILDQPRHISRRQYKQLTSLLTKSRDEDCAMDTATSPKGENFRPVRESNTRVQAVMHCTPDDFGLFMYPEDQQ